MQTFGYTSCDIHGIFLTKGKGEELLWQTESC